MACEPAENTQLVLREQADVGDVEQNHREPVHSETERVAAPLFGIVSFVTTCFIDLLENRRMHDARAGDFDPALATLERFRFHINLEARLGEWKEVRTKLHFRSRTEKFEHEKLEGAFQIGDAYVFIDIKSFDLVKLRAVRGVEFVATIRSPGSNHTNRRGRGLHRSNLHGRSVRSEQTAVR